MAWSRLRRGRGREAVSEVPVTEAGPAAAMRAPTYDVGRRIHRGEQTLARTALAAAVLSGTAWTAIGFFRRDLPVIEPKVSIVVAPQKQPADAAPRRAAAATDNPRAAAVMAPVPASEPAPAAATPEPALAPAQALPPPPDWWRAVNTHAVPRQPSARSAEDFGAAQQPAAVVAGPAIAPHSRTENSVGVEPAATVEPTPIVKARPRPHITTAEPLPAPTTGAAPQPAAPPPAKRQASADDDWRGRLGPTR